MDAIIGIVISAIMVWGFSALAKKQAKNVAEGKGSENFPFPFDLQQDDEEWQEEPDLREVKQVADEKVISEGRRAIPPTIQADEPITIERIENKQTFDLKQAVIYSAILNPKYNDDIL